MIHRCTQEEQGTEFQVTLKSMKDDTQVRTRINDCILIQINETFCSGLLNILRKVAVLESRISLSLEME